MIEVDDARLSYYDRCVERERLAAEASPNEMTRKIHLRLMQRYVQKLASLRHLPQVLSDESIDGNDQMI